MKLKTILFIFVVSFAQFAHAQSEERRSLDGVPRFGFGIQPLLLLIGGIGGEVQYLATETVALSLSGTYIPEHDADSSASDDSGTKSTYRWAYSELTFGTNVMLTGTQFTSGIYVNPFVGYQSSKISDFGDLKLKGSLSSPFAGSTIGYQWVNSVKVAVGAGYRYLKSSDIIIKDESDEEVTRQKSSNLGSLVLEFKLTFLL